MISVTTAVARVIEAQANPRALAPFSETDGDFTIQHAYAIPDALRADLARRGQRAIGWKLGATSPSGQAVMGVKEPACGFLMPQQYASGAKVSAAEFVNLGVEAEIAFRMRTRLVGPGVTVDGAARPLTARWRPSSCRISCFPASPAWPISSPGAHLDCETSAYEV